MPIWLCEGEVSRGIFRVLSFAADKSSRKPGWNVSAGGKRRDEKLIHRYHLLKIRERIASHDSKSAPPKTCSDGYRRPSRAIPCNCLRDRRPSATLCRRLTRFQTSGRIEWTRCDRKSSPEISSAATPKWRARSSTSCWEATPEVKRRRVAPYGGDSTSSDRIDYRPRRGSRRSACPEITHQARCGSESRSSPTRQRSARRKKKRSTNSTKWPNPCVATSNDILRLLEQLLSLMRALAQQLGDSRKEFITMDLDGMYLRIAKQEELCRQIQSLHPAIDSSQRSHALHLHPGRLEATIPPQDLILTERLRGVIRELSEAQAEVARLNQIHAAFLRRSRRTVNMMMNFLAGYSYAYARPAESIHVTPTIAERG